jgi:DNA-binding response OmpR family regulator
MPAASLLIVEDDPEIATALATFGKSRGYTTRIADTGPRAHEEVDKQKPDVILLDVQLPGIDGRDLLKRWKTMGLLATTVVVFVSARDEQSDRILGLELGADDYETKPLQFAMLFRKLERLLEKKRGT